MLLWLKWLNADGQESWHVAEKVAKLKALTKKLAKSSSIGWTQKALNLKCQNSKKS